VRGKNGPQPLCRRWLRWRLSTGETGRLGPFGPEVELHSYRGARLAYWPEDSSAKQ